MSDELEKKILDILNQNVQVTVHESPDGPYVNIRGFVESAKAICELIAPNTFENTSSATSETHTLTMKEMPSFTHGLAFTRDESK